LNIASRASRCQCFICCIKSSGGRACGHMPLRLDGRTGGEEKEKETEREAEVQRCRYGKRRSPGLWIVPGVCGVVAMFHSLPSTPWNELWNSFSPPFFLLNTSSLIYTPTQCRSRVSYGLFWFLRLRHCATRIVTHL
jgi:hypothetical protein